MFGKNFKIVEPKRFDIYIDNVVCEENEALVRIEYGAICKADIRYYLGSRDQKTLGLKYPMSLIHEAVGTVVKDKTNRFKKGERVVLSPNLTYVDDKKCNCEICMDAHLGENYCTNSKFASSSCDGFSREYVNYPSSNLIKIPDDIDFKVAVFTELISVAIAAYRRLDLNGSEKIGIWGDGVLGYITYCVLDCIHGERNTVVIGKENEKLNNFSTDNTFICNDEDIKQEDIEVAIECVGGEASEYAIDEIINSIKVGGRIILTGVSQEGVAINTRKILEKGLSLHGITRSSIDDFEKGSELFKNEKFIRNISKLVISEHNIGDIIDYYNIFEKETYNKELGKNILKFDF